MMNLFKIIREKIAEARRRDAIRETERMVNNDVYVGNDLNDPGNSIYVFVRGVPVSIINDGTESNDPERNLNYIGINDVGKVIGNIKKMDANYLNDKPVNTKSDGNKND